MRALARWRLASIGRVILYAGAIGTACALPLTAGPLRVITHDGGGALGQYLIQTRADALRHREIRIDGWCASACTLYLGVAQTCVTPRARFDFHAPTGGSPAQNAQGARLLAAHLPPILGQWYLRHAAHLRGADFARLSGDDLVAMGAARPCQTAS